MDSMYKHRQGSNIYSFPVVVGGSEESRRHPFYNPMEVQQVEVGTVLTKVVDTCLPVSVE